MRPSRGANSTMTAATAEVNLAPIWRLYDIHLGATGAIEITNLANDLALRVAHRYPNHFIPEHTVWRDLHLRSRDCEICANEALTCQSTLHLAESYEKTRGAWSDFKNSEDAI